MTDGEIDVVHVAKLARLALTPAEIERFGTQLGALLGHVAVLRALPIDDVSATAQIVRASNVLRDDEPAPSLDREDVLAAAPDRQGPYFRVPRILAEPA